MEAPSDQLKLLSDYTLFHIGMYTTLIAALTSVAHFGHKRVSDGLRICIAATVVCFVIAGAAGGAIASNIPNYANFSTYAADHLNVFGVRPFTYWIWAHIEHGAFWLGLWISVLGLLFAERKP